MKVVITGGCSGLGLEFTKYMASLGHTVYALYNRSVDNAKGTGEVAESSHPERQP